MASMEAGVLCSILTQPVWVIKTRMLLNVDPKIKGLGNLLDATREILRQHGAGGFFRGLGINIILSVNGIVQMQTY